MLLRQIFDPYLAQYAYLVGCQKTHEALIIDPQRDIYRYQQIAATEGLQIAAAAETHIHADFVSGVAEFASDPTIHIYLSGEGGKEWSYQWPGKRALTHFLKHQEHFMVGNIKIQVLHTPGHTPEHISFLITDQGADADRPMALISGDFIFVGDVGRPDLLEAAVGVKDAMEPSALLLQRSLSEQLKEFEDYLQILPAHGAGSACGKSLGAVPTTTLGYERRFNKPLKLALSDGPAFVKDILTGQPDPPLYFSRMKRVNRDGIKVTGGLPEVPGLTPLEFKKITVEPGVKLLDTRQDRLDFGASHVSRAINAPLRTTYFTISAGSYLSEEDKIILLLEDPSDLNLAVRQLYRIGLDNICGWITLESLKAAKLLTKTIRRIEFVNLKPEIAIKEGIVLDVRTTAEFKSGHLLGAKSIPFTRLKSRLAEIPKELPLFVHCGAGKRAVLATSFLCSEGYNATHIDGAIPTKLLG